MHGGNRPRTRREGFRPVRRADRRGEQLVFRVWGTEAESGDTLSNMMDVLIYNLRTKLGRDLITTRRGHGYCIP